MKTKSDGKQNRKYKVAFNSFRRTPAILYYTSIKLKNLRETLNAPVQTVERAALL